MTATTTSQFQAGGLPAGDYTLDRHAQRRRVAHDHVPEGTAEASAAGGDLRAARPRGPPLLIAPLAPPERERADRLEHHRCAAAAVMSAWSYGGETSTTSIAASSTAADDLPDRAQQLAGQHPARLGVPVPGAMPGSITSMSTDR